MSSIDQHTSPRRNNVSVEIPPLSHRNSTTSSEYRNDLDDIAASNTIIDIVAINLPSKTTSSGSIDINSKQSVSPTHLLLSQLIPGNPPPLVTLVSGESDDTLMKQFISTVPILYTPTIHSRDNTSSMTINTSAGSTIYPSQVTRQNSDTPSPVERINSILSTNPPVRRKTMTSLDLVSSVAEFNEKRKAMFSMSSDTKETDLSPATDSRRMTINQLTVTDDAHSSRPHSALSHSSEHRIPLTMSKEMKKDVINALREFDHDANTTIIGDVGGGEVARAMIDLNIMRRRIEDPESARYIRVLWEVYYWTAHVIGSVGVLFFLCLGILTTMAFIVRSAIPNDYWWIKMLIDIVLAIYVCMWPFVAIKHLLRPEFCTSIQWYMPIPSIAVLCAYLVFLHAYAETAFPSYRLIMRQAMLLVYIANVAVCAWNVRNSQAKRLGCYVMFAYGIPVLVIPLYSIAIAPYTRIEGDAQIVVTILIKYIMHTVITDGIVSIVRTLAIVSMDAIAPEVMYVMVCMPQLVSAFYGRILLMGMQNVFDVRWTILAMAIIKLLGFSLMHERHKVTRFIFRYVVLGARKFKALFKRKKALPPRPGSRASSVMEDSDSDATNPRETTNLVTPTRLINVQSIHSNSQELIEPTPTDDAAKPLARLKRTISLTDMTYVTELEVQRFDRIVPDMLYTSILYEFVSIIIVPLVFIMYFDTQTSTVDPEDLWAMCTIVALQYAAEIVVVVIGVFIMEKRNITILQTASRHGLVAFGIEAMYYLHGFILMFLMLPMYTIWPDYAPHWQH